MGPLPETSFDVEEHLQQLMVVTRENEKKTLPEDW